MEAVEDLVVGQETHLPVVVNEALMQRFIHGNEPFILIAFWLKAMRMNGSFILIAFNQKGCASCCCRKSHSSYSIIVIFRFELLG